MLSPLSLCTVHGAFVLCHTYSNRSLLPFVVHFFCPLTLLAAFSLSIVGKFADLKGCFFKGGASSCMLEIVFKML